LNLSDYLLAIYFPAANMFSGVSPWLSYASIIWYVILRRWWN